MAEEPNGFEIFMRMRGRRYEEPTNEEGICLMNDNHFSNHSIKSSFIVIGMAAISSIDNNPNWTATHTH